MARYIHIRCWAVVARLPHDPHASLILSLQLKDITCLMYCVPTFAPQSQSNDAILDCCNLLGEPRHCLGIVASSRGYIAGRIAFRGEVTQYTNKYSTSPLIRNTVLG